MDVELSQYLWCTPSPVARRLLWHVLGLGRSRYGGEVRYEPFGKPGAVLLWVESGGGVLEIGGERHELRRGPTFHLYELDRPRAYRPTPGRMLTIRTVRFSGPMLHIWIEELLGTSSGAFAFSAHGAGEIRRDCRRLRRLVEAKSPDWEWRVHAALGELLHRFFSARCVLEANPGDLPEPIQRALAALSGRPSRDWTARELTKAAGMSYSSFHELFRRHMHETIHEHLQRRRCDVAQALLSDGRLQIKAIAKRLHFASDHYFSYFFRRQTGMSPTEYRRRLGLPEGR